MKALLLVLFAAGAHLHGTPTTEQLSPKVGLPDTLPAGFDGTLPIANHHVDRSLNEIIFTWKLLKFPPAGSDAPAFTAAVGKVHLPDFKPRSEGPLQLKLPAIWKDADALRILVNEFNGELITSRTWPLKNHEELLHAPSPAVTAPPVELLGRDPIRIRCGERIYSFSASTGQLSGVTIQDRDTGLANGPRLVAKPAGAATAPSVPVATSVSVQPVRNVITIDTLLGSKRNTFRWTVHPGGNLQLDYRFVVPPGTYHHVGIAFDLPTAKVTSKRWLGPGPDFGLWEHRSRDDGFFGSWPGVVWMTIDLPDAALTIIPPDGKTSVALLRPSGQRTAPPSILEDSGGLFILDPVAPDPVARDGPLTGSVVFRAHPKDLITEERLRPDQ